MNGAEISPDKIFVGIPVLNRLDLLGRCVAALDYPAEIVIINNNSVDPDFRRELDSFAETRQLTVLHQERNLGVPASWNLIIRTGFARGYDWVFIGSNDTFLRPGSLKAAVDYDKNGDGGLWQLCGYNFFLVGRKTIEFVGWFDENFYPAYKEDQDYHYRCKLAGLQLIHVPDAGGDHVGSATIKSNPAYAVRNRVTHGSWNVRYYCLKWGGDWPQERFKHPYNNPEHDHKWWPDPGATIEERDWDRESREAMKKPESTNRQRMSRELEAMYYAAWQTQSDIHEHVPALRFYASLCEHVTEFVRANVSTVAFLAGQPRKLVSYSLWCAPDTEALNRVRGESDFAFVERNALEVEIDPTDLLFIDTFHTYNQLKRELELHHGNVSRYIILHDTAIFGYQNEIEDGSAKNGLLPALQEFLLAQPDWKVEQLYWNCNGLAVLKKTAASG